MKHTYLMSNLARLSAFCALAPLVFSSVYASTIIDPVSVNSPQGDYGGAYSLANIIDQSGL